jgi:MSHA biogenesis protein MshM
MDLNSIHVYYSELSGTPRLGVVYGSYPTRSAATADLQQLPKSLRANKPYPRLFVRLR